MVTRENEPFLLCRIQCRSSSKIGCELLCICDEWRARAAVQQGPSGPVCLHSLPWPAGRNSGQADTLTHFHTQTPARIPTVGHSASWNGFPASSGVEGVLCPPARTWTVCCTRDTWTLQLLGLWPSTTPPPTDKRILNENDKCPNCRKS